MTDDLPPLEEILDGDIVDAYSVDESIDNSNAGDAIVYDVGGRHFRIITWNERALDHIAGDIDIDEVEVEDNDE
jgi:hypothetical protein